MASRDDKGFTIVELVVTIAILIILTTIAVVRLSQTQVGGRDQERKIDTETIATGLEVYYENGSSGVSIPKGYYPGATQVQAAASSSPPFHKFLEGVSRTTFEAPDRTISDSFGVHPTDGTNADGSYTDAQARTLLATYPYLYQPVTRNDVFCTWYSDCVKFFLYYLEERTDTVVMVRSKNQ